MDQIWTPEFAASGAIIPLDDLVGKSSTVKKDLYFPGAWASNVYQGKQWGIPLNNDVWEEDYYNQAMFQSAGVNAPKTWDDLTNAAKKLTKSPNQFAIGLLGHKGEDTVITLFSFIYSNGGSVLSPDGKTVTITDPKTVEALDFYLSLVPYAPEGTISRDEGGSADLFTAGKIAMTWDGSWQQDTYTSRAPKLEWGCAMMPAPKGRKFVGALGGWNMAIYKQSSHSDAAFKWIEYLSRKDVQTEVNSLIPARNDAGKDFVQKYRKSPEVILDTINAGLPRPISPVYPQVSDAMQTMMQDMLSGTKVKDAVDKAAKAIEGIIKQAQ